MCCSAWRLQDRGGGGGGGVGLWARWEQVVVTLGGCGGVMV